MDKRTVDLPTIIKAVEADLENDMFCFEKTNLPVVRSITITKPSPLCRDGSYRKTQPNANKETRYILLGGKLETDIDAVPVKMTTKFAALYPQSTSDWKITVQKNKSKKEVKRWTKQRRSVVVPWVVARGSRPLRIESSEAMATAGIPIACSCPDWQYSRFKPASASDERKRWADESTRRRSIYLAPQGCKHMIAWRIHCRRNRQKAYNK